MMRPGDLLDGRYRLEARLGFGGMGEVWRCADTRLPRTVAVKVLRPDLVHDPEQRRRFQQEAHALAALDAPGIVRLYDFSGDVLAPGAVPYLVMAYVPGRTLTQLLAEAGRLPPMWTAGLLAGLARALGRAHDAGIVHRDIKPGNVIVGAHGEATLVDFGIAYSRTQTSRHTDPRHVVGTLSYISPEQLHGVEPTPETDVYSLGIVAYECLAGRPPYAGGTAAVVAGHTVMPPPALPTDVPGPIAEVVTRSIAKDPAARYRTGAELAAAFEAAVRPGAPARPRRKRGRPLAAAAVTGAVAAAAAVGIALAPHGTGALTPGTGASAPQSAASSGHPGGTCATPQDVGRTAREVYAGVALSIPELDAAEGADIDLDGPELSAFVALPGKELTYGMPPEGEGDGYYLASVAEVVIAAAPETAPDAAECECAARRAPLGHVLKADRLVDGAAYCLLSADGDPGLMVIDVDGRGNDGTAPAMTVTLTRWEWT